jgi:uncharacterized protein YerC
MTIPRPATAAVLPPVLDEAAAARSHVAVLRNQGGTYRSIAQAAGLATMTVHGLAAGRTRPQGWTAAAVLAINGETLAPARVDAGGTRLRLRALHVMGHGSARIARAAGVSPAAIRAVVRGDTTTVTCRLGDAVAVIYDAWWDKRAPERTSAERAAATRARRRAIAGNWCAGAALDDDQIDMPGYQPEHGWRPALGTGTARDLSPLSRSHSSQEAGR